MEPFIIEMTINVWVKCMYFEGSRPFLRNFSPKKKKRLFLRSTKDEELCE